MKMLSRLLTFLLLLTYLESPGVTLQTNPEKEPPTVKPVVVTQKEVDSHRIGKRPVLRVKLNKRQADKLTVGIAVRTTVDTDGAITETIVDDRVPRTLGLQAESAVRALRYRPFQRDGRMVKAELKEVVRVLPPERLPTRHTPFPVVRDLKSVRITLERTGCHGMCPRYAVEIHGDGTVNYDGWTFVAIKGHHRGSMLPEAVLELVNKFRQADYYSLRDRYACRVSDQPTYETSIEINGEIKRVEDYAGEEVGMPLAVSELESSIDDLADTARWTKGNTNTILALKEEMWDFRSAEAAASLARIVFYGNVEAVRDLVAAGVPLSGIDNLRMTVLQRAAWRDNPNMLHVLLAAGPWSTEVLESSLAIALRFGNTESVRVLRDQGARLDWRDANGETMLMEAASSGVPSLVREILKYHLDVNARDSGGWTPLLYAVGKYHYGEEPPPVNRAEVVILLLAAGADPNVQNGDGDSALLNSAYNEEAALALIKGGANVNVRNKRGETPLMRQYWPSVIRVLLEKGADPSSRDRDGMTAVDLARRDGLEQNAAMIEAAERAKGATP